MSPALPESVPASRRLRLLYNPTAGRVRRPLVERAVAALARAGWSIERAETERRGHAEHLAATAAGDGEVGRLVVAGGDGTINEAVNGLLRANQPLPLAILPMGTANVLAHELGLMPFARAVKAAGAARLAQIRPGRANGRHFTMMVGAGLDAHVVAAMRPGLKRLFGRQAYVLETLRQLFRFRFPTYRVLIDDLPYEAASVVVAKGRLYGGAYLLAPAARLGSPTFEVCLFRSTGRLAVLRYGLALVTGRLPSRKDFLIRTGRRVEIGGPVGDPVQGDGDIIGHLPMTVTLADRSIQIAVGEIAVGDAD
jgi:YegS/Rv2252/BmrU family lipid kinase